MRDPERIDQFLAELGRLWKEHPQYRFGQLVMNLSRGQAGFLDHWEWEEDAWLERIYNYRENYGRAIEAGGGGVKQDILAMVDRLRDSYKVPVPPEDQ